MYLYVYVREYIFQYEYVCINSIHVSIYYVNMLLNFTSKDYITRYIFIIYI